MAGNLEEFVNELLALMDKLEELDTELLSARERAEESYDMAAVTFSVGQMESPIGTAIVSTLEARVKTGLSEMLHTVSEVQNAVQRMIARTRGQMGE